MKNYVKIITGVKNKRKDLSGENGLDPIGSILQPKNIWCDFLEGRPGGGIFRFWNLDYYTRNKAITS